MSKLRTTVLIFLSAILIAIYTRHGLKQNSHIETEPKNKEGRETAPQSIFSSVSPKDIVGVTIDNFVSNEKVVLSKEGEVWWVSVPVHFPAMEPVVGAFLGILTSNAQLRSIEQKEKMNWAEYGLEKPDLKVCMQTRNGANECLLLGGLAPLGIGNYARVEGKKGVLILSPEFKNVFLNVTGYSISRKQIFPYVLSQSKRIFIKQNDVIFEFVKKEKKWFASKPSEHELTDEKMEKLLNLLTGIYVREFVSGNKKEPSYGLDRPQNIRIQADYENGSEIVLELGFEAPGIFSYFAEYNDWAQILLISKEKIDELMMTCTQIASLPPKSE